MSTIVNFEVEINDDGTLSISKEYSLYSSNCTLGEATACFVDGLLYEIKKEAKYHD